MLMPSPNHGTLWLHNDDDDDDICGWVGGCVCMCVYVGGWVGGWVCVCMYVCVCNILLAGVHCHFSRAHINIVLYDYWILQLKESFNQSYKNVAKRVDKPVLLPIFLLSVPMKHC